MKSLIQRYPLGTFFVLSYLYLWIGGAGFFSGFIPLFGEWPVMYKGHEIDKVRIWRSILIWTPNFAMITVLWIVHGRESVRKVFSQFLRWRVGVRWWLIAFGIPIGLALISVGFHKALGGSLEMGYISDLPFVFLLLLAQSLTESGIGEEAGWRGFSLPRLQKRFGPLLASIFIGLAWGFWHTPLFIFLRYSLMDVTSFLIMILGLSIIYTWIYNGSGQSLLMIAIIHNVGNTIDMTLSNRGSAFAAMLSEKALGSAFNVVLLGFVILLLLLTKGRLGLSSGINSVN